VAASTQRQALNALVFLYKLVLGQAYQGQLHPCEGQETPPSPVVMTKIEVCQVLNRIKGTYLPMAKVMYGEGFPGGEESPGNPVISSHTKVQTSLSSTMAKSTSSDNGLL